MPAPATELAPPVNHVFVDFENVHEIDLSIIGSKAVTFTLLVGSKQTKLDASLVEKLFTHASVVQLVRLTSPGKNALDFTLAYYIGQAVAADPTGYFHIISKDTGFDPLITHLLGKHIRVRRHDSFATLIFAARVKPPIPNSPTATPKLIAQTKSKVQPSILDQREKLVLEQLRKSPSSRPPTHEGLLKYLAQFLKLTEVEVFELIEYLSQAGHLVINQNDKVTYHLATK